MGASVRLNASVLLEERFGAPDGLVELAVALVERLPPTLEGWWLLLWFFPSPFGGFQKAIAPLFFAPLVELAEALEARLARGGVGRELVDLLAQILPVLLAAATNHGSRRQRRQFQLHDREAGTILAAFPVQRGQFLHQALGLGRRRQQQKTQKRRQNEHSAHREPPFTVVPPPN